MNTNKMNYCVSKPLKGQLAHKNSALNFKSNFKKIDIDTWDRANLFRTFRDWQDPYQHTNLRLDVTNLLGYCKEKDLKGSHAIIHLITKGLNAIPQYRTRLLTDGSIVEFEKINPVFSVSVAPGKPFSAAGVEFDANPKVHMQRIADKIAEVKKTDGGDFPEHYFTDQDNVHMSCLRDLDFTSIKCGITTPQDSKPLVSWGKYSPEETVAFIGEKVVPVKKVKSQFFLRTHHGFADGDHIAEFFNNLQKYFNSPEEVLSEKAIK